MTEPQWWRYQTFAEARARQRQQLDAATRDVGSHLMKGDVRGARLAMAKAAPNSAVPKANDWRKKFAQQFQAARSQGRANEVGEKLGEFAEKAVAGVIGSEGERARSYLKRRPWYAPANDESDEEVVETAEKFRAKERGSWRNVGEDLMTLASGEKLQDRLGINTEYMDRLREKGFGGRLLSAAIDTATAPATYVPFVGAPTTIGARGAGVGGRLAGPVAGAALRRPAGQAATSALGRNLAARWGGEVAAGTAGMVVGEEGAKYAAEHTRNPYVVAAAGLGAGLLAGGGGYAAGYKGVDAAPAAVRAGQRASRATDAALSSRMAARYPGVEGMASAEAGQAVVFRPGDRLVHSTASPFEDADLRPSTGGVQGGGAYVTADAGGGMEAIGRNQYSNPDDIGARAIITTPTRPLNALVLNAPAEKREIQAVRKQLSASQRQMFDQVLAGAEGVPSGRTIRNGLEMAFGDEAAAQYALLRQQYTDAARAGKPLPDVADVDVIYNRKVDAALARAGFPTTAVKRGDVWEVPIRNPREELQSWFDWEATRPRFDRAAATAAAERYFAGARNLGEAKAGLPPGVTTVDDVVTLQESLFNTAQEGARGRFWYERSGKAILRMFGGDKHKANQFSQLIAIYSPSREIKDNFDLALRAWNQAAAGDPITVGSMDQWKAAQKVVEGIDWEGRKTGNFYGNMLGYIDPDHPDADELLNAVTVDRHMGTAYGFPTIKPGKGSQSKSGGSVSIGKGPRYDFIETQTQELARQLGWTPEQTQAAIWVVEKARKSKGRISLDTATKDFADSLEETWAQVSWEAAPGRNTGFLPGYHTAGEMEKMEYFVQADKAFMDADGVDILAREMGVVSPGEVRVQGVYRGESGELELNPSGQTRVAMGPALKSTSVNPLEVKPEGFTGRRRVRGKPPYVEANVKPGALGPIIDKDGNFLVESYKIPGNEYALEPAAVRLTNAYAAARALLLHQESVAWTKPVAVTTAADGDGLAASLGRTLTKDESAALAEKLGSDVFIVGTEDGAWFLNASWSGVDNETFHNVVEQALTGVVPEDIRTTVFRNGGSYIEGGANGTGFKQAIAEAGLEDAFERASAVLQPRLEAIAGDFAERYGWNRPAAAAAGGLSGEAGQISASLAVPLASGAAGAAYGYATGDTAEERWKRALAGAFGGAMVGAAGAAGPRLFNPSVTPTTAPRRPSSILSQLPATAIENRYTNASGIDRVIPKPGVTRALQAVDAKRAALKTNAGLRSLPPVLKNGVAFLLPTVNQDQDVLVAWRAAQGVRAQLQTEWTSLMAPKVQAIEELVSATPPVYKGPTGTAADGLIGTVKDIAENPELYDITPELRTALDDLNVTMWDEIAARARADYGVEVRPFEGDRKPGFVYLPTMAVKEDLDSKIDSAFASLSTKANAKRRGYTTARDRVLENPEFVPETDLGELVGVYVQAMASNAGHATLREGAGGRHLVEVLDELHPGLSEAKTRVRGFVTNLNTRLKTATRTQAETLKKMSMNDTELRQLEKRMRPLEARIAELEVDGEFGAELSFLSGQVRELRMMRGKLATYAKTLEGRKTYREGMIKQLDGAIDSAHTALDELVRRYQSAGTDPYVRDALTGRWYTPEGAKTVKELLKVPNGFGKQMAWLSDEIRAWHLAGDTSLGTIQGGLGVMSDPISAAKMARKMMGRRPTEEIARIARDEADDVAEYTFATGRQFGTGLQEMRLERRGVERIPGVKAAQDELYALFSRGSYEAWKHERDILLTQNPDLPRGVANEEAANMLSKVVPGLNPADRGVSSQRAAVERAAATSISFAAAPALLGAEAAKGTAQLARQAMLRMAKSASADPHGAWAALTPREQIAVRRVFVGSSVVASLAAGSAILSAESRNMSVEDAVRETFDPNSRYFMAFQLGQGRSIPLGGPFRSAIKAIVPDRDGVMFGNLPSFFGTRINSPIKPAVDIYRNRDFFDDPIYEGNAARPENLARILWYAADQGALPVSLGTLSQDIRKGEFEPVGTSTRVAAQFFGTNLSPVSPTEKLNQRARGAYGKPFYDLLPSQQKAIKEANPKLWDFAVREGSEERQAAEAKKAQIKADQLADDKLLLAGKLTVEKWTEASDDRGNQLVGANDVLYRDNSRQASKPVDPVLDEYYQRIKKSADANNGRVDWDEVGAWVTGLPKSKQSLIDSETGLNDTPLEKMRSKLSKEYYSLPRYRGFTSEQAYDIDGLWQEVRNQARSGDRVQMLAAIAKMDLGGYDKKIVQGVKRRILGLLDEDTQRANWVKSRPESAIFQRRGNLTEGDIDAINKAMRRYR